MNKVIRLVKHKQVYRNSQTSSPDLQFSVPVTTALKLMVHSPLLRDGLRNKQPQNSNIAVELEDFIVILRKEQCCICKQREKEKKKKCPASCWAAVKPSPRSKKLNLQLGCSC